MHIRTLVAPFFASAILLGSVQFADAHLRITSHQSRSADDQKPGPCGAVNVRSTDKVYIAKPGTEVTFSIDEYIAHPGFFRVDVDLDGQDGLLTPVVECLDKTSIPDCFDTTNTGPYMVNNIQNGDGAFDIVYTLPDVECTNCTLQIVQAMTDKAPYEVNGNEMYHQCIDIVLANDGPDILTLMGGGNAADAGPGGADASASNPADPDAGQVGGGPVDGGCACRTSGVGSSSGSVFFGLLILACWWRRRTN